jgi:hypothetical protein
VAQWRIQLKAKININGIIEENNKNRKKSAENASADIARIAAARSAAALVSA